MPKKGYKQTLGHRKKIQRFQKKRKHKPQEGFRKRNQFGKMNKGNKLSNEHKRKIIKACKKAVGKLGRNWKDGRCNSKEYLNWLSNRHYYRKKIAKGSHTWGEWELLKKQYNYTCPCCGKREPKIKLTQDHIIPISKGGSDNIENIQPLCQNCNSKKYTKTINY